jgi:hypothetical protein
MAQAAVPVATVYENRHLCAGKHNVDNHVQAGWSGIGPEAKTEPMNCRPQLQFGA